MSLKHIAAVRRVLYLSGTRADFGLMRSTLQHVAADPAFVLGVVVTGVHLSATHGHTVDEIRAAGLPVVAELPVDVLTLKTHAHPCEYVRGRGALLARYGGAIGKAST